MFMACRKSAWSQLGVEVEADVDMGAGGCGGVGSRAGIGIKREPASLYYGILYCGMEGADVAPYDA